MLLSPDDMRDLTDSAASRGQIAWLREHGWVFEVSRLGKPKVLRAYAEYRLGMPTARPETANEPNWDMMG